jgi:hypothetical protein
MRGLVLFHNIGQCISRQIGLALPQQARQDVSRQRRMVDAAFTMLLALKVQ